MADNKIEVVLTLLGDSFQSGIDNAISEMKSFQGTVVAGIPAANNLERAFNTLGINSATAIESAKTRINAAYDAIAKNQKTSIEELNQAHAARAKALEGIERQAAEQRERYPDQMKAKELAATNAVKNAYEQLGIKSAASIEASKDRINRAFEEIKNSGTATASEIKRAEAARAKAVEDIDRQSHVMREGMLTKFKQNWLAITASLTAAYALVMKGWDYAEQAARYEQSRQAFRSMVQAMGKEAETEFEKIRQKSAGLIDDQALVEAANRAISFGIPIEKIGVLMDIARAKARDMGTTTASAFNDIVTGIGRSSPMILDNLGLVLKLGAANEEMARSLHKTVEQLTLTEQRQAILNATIEAGSEALERHNLAQMTQLEAMQKWKAMMTDTSRVIGDVLLRALAGLWSAIWGIGAAFNAGIAIITRGFQKILELGTYVPGVIGKSFRDMAEAVKGFADNSFAAAKEGGDRAALSFQAMVQSATMAANLKPPMPRGSDTVTADPKEAAKKAAEAYRMQLEEVKKFNAGYIEDMNNVLETKEKLKQFDDAYFEAYMFKLQLQGKTEEQVLSLVVQRRKELAEKSVAVVKESGTEEVKTVMTIEDYKQTIARESANTIKSLWHGNTRTFKDVWMSSLDSFVDVMAQMLISTRVTTTAMKIEMAGATAGISLVAGLIATTFMKGKGGGGKSALQQATDDFLSSIKETLKSFEDETLSTLQKLTNMQTEGTSFAGEILKSWQDVAKKLPLILAGPANQSLDALSDWARLAGDVTQDYKTIFEVMNGMDDIIRNRYSLEKGLINDIIGILKNKKSFVADIDRTITDVERSGFTPEQMFEAEKGDIADLTRRLSGATGQERVDIAGLLKQAYLSYFDTAKSLFSGSDLEQIQKEVVAGLELVKSSGAAGFDQLIKVNLDILNSNGIQVDLQTDMVKLLEKLAEASQGALAMLDNFVKAYQSGNQPGQQAAIAGLVGNPKTGETGFLQTLGLIPKMASGGVVDRPTLLVAGEGRQKEAIIPLDTLWKELTVNMRKAVVDLAGQLNQGQGLFPDLKSAIPTFNLPSFTVPRGALDMVARSTTNNYRGGDMTVHQTFHVSMPNVKGLEDVTVQEAIKALRGPFRQAAEVLGRNNITWPMRPTS